MAFNFIKKVFSFGRKQAEEKEQAAEEPKPLGLPEPAAPAAQEPLPPSPPEPQPPSPPEPQPPSLPEPQPAPAQPTPEVPTPEPEVAPAPAEPEIEPAAEPEPAPAPVEIPVEPAPPAPETPTRARAAEPVPVPAETSVAEQPSDAAEASSSSLDTGEHAAPAPSLLREGPAGEAERVEEPRTPSDQGPAQEREKPTEARTSADDEIPEASEATVSGPDDHLPPREAGHAAPTLSLKETSIDEAAHDAVAEAAVTAAVEPQPPATDRAPAPAAEGKPAAAEAPSSPSRDGSVGEPEQAVVAQAPAVVATAAQPAVPDSIAPTPAGRVTVSRKVEQKAEAAKPAEAAPKPSWLQRLKQGLSRSSKELSGNIAGVFTKRKLDEDTLQDLEDVLIRADLGMETAIRVTDALASGRYGKNVSDDEVRAIMAEEVEKVLKPVALPLELDLSHKPHVILVVGVNGTGKTTTIGKLAAKLTEGGLSVTLAAGDTFRAAAIEQLKIWGERTGSPVVSSKLGADAAGLAYDAFEKAKEAGSDVLIIDTAGRLQNKAELMAELEKIVRVLGKLDPEAPHTVLQTVDATTGQNALNQVEIFRNVAGVNGLVMTKLDGTARGGILVAIAAKHKLPVYFIGVGEQVDDLEPFSASDFAKAIAGVA